MFRRITNRFTISVEIIGFVAALVTLCFTHYVFAQTPLFFPPVTYRTGSGSLNTGTNALAVADVNRDGKQDVVILNEGAGVGSRTPNIILDLASENSNVTPYRAKVSLEGRRSVPVIPKELWQRRSYSQLWKTSDRTAIRVTSTKLICLSKTRFLICLLSRYVVSEHASFPSPVNALTRPPLAARPTTLADLGTSALGSLFTHSLCELTHSLRGGPLFPGSSTTPVIGLTGICVCDVEMYTPPRCRVGLGFRSEPALLSLRSGSTPAPTNQQCKRLFNSGPEGTVRLGRVYGRRGWWKDRVKSRM